MNAGPIHPTDAQWQAQEHALRCGDTRADRMLAQALRTLPVAAPPPDFVRGTVRALQGQVPARRHDRHLDGVMVGLLAVASASVLVTSAWRYGPGWRPLTEAFSGNALAWTGCAAACLAIAAIPWRRMAGVVATLRESQG
ncbi:hypothetical protein [Luteimonas sp. FCS-9]|uniref:hypothetical protein n=1 Tax=Luteimonas sp. FCS-9 TaxID=1547516 RepID=UPI00063EA7A7|nr:hypothetical protein [Luteimonas sp. FCS-9]KLI99018.1 hypothetical protein WQ56_13720 [Luteimonas sp. FCS-9]